MSNTLNIGSKIVTLRKARSWSQGDLAQQIEASREIIGKYERNENLPSIEMVAKMAKAFGVTVDFLIGEDENASYEKETVERINDIQKMDADTQSVLFNVIDTYIQLQDQKGVRQIMQKATDLVAFVVLFGCRFVIDNL